MSRPKRLTVTEITDILENDETLLDCFIIILPSNGAQSDQDSGEEDEVSINRLSGNQLLCDAEATVTRIIDGEVVKESISEIIESDQVSENTSFDSDIKNATPNKLTTNAISDIRPQNSSRDRKKCVTQAISKTGKRKFTEYNYSNINPNIDHSFAYKSTCYSNPKEKQNACSTPSADRLKGKKKNLQPRKVRNWVKEDIYTHPETEFEFPQWLQVSDGDPIKLFELFYDDEVIKMICDFSNLYAYQKGNHNLNLTVEEVKVFFAVLLVSGYCQVARRRMYWEQRPDAYNKAISNAISRNRFDQIMRYIHVCDNTNLTAEDKFAKVTPLYQKLNDRWLQYFPGDVTLSVDESMIPYFGRHSAKQHIHGKPIRFGYKAWCLCSRLGYLVQTKLYQGASTGNTNPCVGVGGSVVLDLTEKLSANKQYSIYFDNFFTSISLLEKLQQKGFQGTGTIKANRIEKANLFDLQLMKKTPRGSFDQLTDRDSGVTLVRYNDNSIVTIASTRAGVMPVVKVKRFSQAQKKYIMVDQPSCIVQYNTYMGGVDRLDENISKMRVNIRGKKWYWQLLAFPLNVSVNNAWQLHRWAYKNKGENSEALDLLRFTCGICLVYLHRYSQRLALGRSPRNILAVDKRISEQVHFDGMNHLIVPNAKQSRCAQCKKKMLV